MSGPSDVSWPWKGPPPSDARVRALLLPLTLAHARRARWYRKAWGKRARLEELPFLTKPLAVAHARELLVGATPPFVGVVSSGTQHGDREPLRVPETDAEREAMAAFADARGPFESAGRGLHLEVLSMQHGFPEGPAPEGTLRVPWSFTAGTFQLLQALLLEPQAGGRRVESLVIGAGALVPLTAWLYERGADFSRLRVQAIGTTGFRLGPHWRARVEALWGARVHDNFSLSELAVPAPQCEACAHHHFALPAIEAEVIDPFTHQPVEVGVLVVSTLWPFVQAMPLIRYWTGDLVSLGPRCAAYGERGFRFEGRQAQCVLQRGAKGCAVLASPLALEAFLDGRPEVARLAHPAVQLGLVKSPDVGVPRFELSSSTRARVTHVTARVEVRFEPLVFPAQARRLTADTVAALRKASPALRRAERAGTAQLTVELVRPGALVRPWSKF